MSDCKDPNCPEHGSNPRAIALRQAQQEIVTNDELMSAIRVMAANALENIQFAARKKGLPIHPTAQEKVFKILSGDADDDPLLQGIIRGMTMLMAAGHDPTKIFVTECAKVREAPFITDRMIEQEMERNPVPEPLVMALSFDDLMAFLKGRF